MVFVRLEVLYVSCQYNLRRWVRLLFFFGGGCILYVAVCSDRRTLDKILFILPANYSSESTWRRGACIGASIKGDTPSQIIVSALGKHSSISFVEILRLNALLRGCDSGGVNLAQSFI